jgi:hypothetical protein
VVLVGVGALLLLGFGLWLVHLDHFRYGAAHPSEMKPPTIVP